MRKNEYENLLLAHQEEWDKRVDKFIQILVEKETTFTQEYFERLADWCAKPYETDEEEYAFRHYLFNKIGDMIGGLPEGAEPLSIYKIPTKKN